MLRFLVVYSGQRIETVTVPERPTDDGELLVFFTVRLNLLKINHKYHAKIYKQKHMNSREVTY